MSGLRVNTLRGASTGTSPTFPDGVIVSGVTTSTSFSGNLTGNVTGNVTGNITGTTGTFTGNVSVGGTLTYEDVSNIDSVGVITARSGIRIGAGQSVSAVSGIVTYYGDGSQLTGVESGVGNFVASGTIPNGATVIIKTDGTVGIITEVADNSATVGTPAVFDTSASMRMSSVYDTTANKMVVIYGDYGDSWKGKSAVGTISGEAVSFGAPSQFESGNTQYTSIAYDPDTNRVIAHYADNGNNSYATWCVGELSGTAVSWGSPSSYYGNSIQDTATVYDTTNNKIILIWNNSQSGELRAVTGTVTGSSTNTLNLGGTQEIGNSSNSPDHIAAIWHTANSRVVVFFENVDDSNKGYYAVGTGSGSNTQSWSSVAFFTTVAIDSLSATYDSDNERIVVAYRDTSNSNYGTAMVGSLSGNTITWGSAVVFNAGDTEEIRATYDSDNNRVIIAYKDAGNSNYGAFVGGIISGSNNRTITFTTEKVFRSGSISGVTVTYAPDAQRSLISYSDGGTSGDGKGVVVRAGNLISTNLTTENYIGIAAEAIADTATGKVNILGGVNTGQTGLTTAKTYYVQGNGTLGTSAGSPSVVAGTSISSTKILIR